MRHELRGTLSNELLVQFNESVALRLGLSFPEARYADLQRGLLLVLKQLKLPLNDEGIRILLATHWTKRQFEIIASQLTVGETYFFRDSSLFEALKNEILPNLIESRKNRDKNIRIWSAGCCTGEEPYSVAITINELISDLENWNITLLASDINLDFLTKLKTGKYSKWSFRGADESLINRYFRKDEKNQYEIQNKIKKMIIPAYLNLAEDSFPSLLNNTNAMDVIICRNVLMYFTPEAAKGVIDRFHRALVEDGILIVGPSETSIENLAKFTVDNSSGVIIYRKADSLSREFVPVTIIPNLIYQQEPITGSFVFNASVVEMAKTDLAEVSTNNEKYTKEKEHVDYLKDAQDLNKQGLYEQAVTILQNYIRNNDNDAEAFALMAQVLANQGKLREAFAWCEKAILTNKLNPFYQYLLATIFQELENLEEALVSFKRAIYLDQSFILAHLAVGNVSARLGKIQESKRSYRNVLDLLKKVDSKTELPGADGITAKRLEEIIETITT